MKLFKYLLLFSVFTCLCSSTLLAQKRDLEWQVGYFAPYISNWGGTVGLVFDLKELGGHANEQRKSNKRLQLLTQLSYFNQINVSHNFLLNPELVYRWNRLGKRFFITSAIGSGYLLSYQRQDGSLNLGTGEITYSYNALNYFLPTVNLGFGVAPKKYLGFNFKATYGRKLSVNQANADFLGLSAGLIIKFNSK